MAERSADDSNDTDLLPCVDQKWVHAVDTKATLLKAVAGNSMITAIETDVLMGHVVVVSADSSSSAARNNTIPIPIMAHPPNTESDLPMTDFLDIISKNSDNNNNKEGVTKVVKLDFKELDVVEPTLKAIMEKGLQTTGNGIFFLNADILEGPGHRGDGAVTIPASTFMDTCLKYIRLSDTNNKKTRFAFSLGFKADCTSTQGYATGDVQAMSDLIAHYKLLPPDDDDSSAAADSEKNCGSIGVVLALNARQLVRSMNQFDSIMKRFPDLQILVWTGKGEPAVPRVTVDAIGSHFGTMASRIGFDCQVNENYWSGIATDYLVVSYGYYKRAIEFLSGR